MSSGALSGTAYLSQTSFVIEKFDLYTYPTFTGVDVTLAVAAQYHYTRPDLWNMELKINAKSSLVIREIVEASISEVSDKALADYVDSTVVLESELLLQLASRGEYFRIEVEVESSEMAPTVLLGADEARIKLVLAAVEKVPGKRDEGSFYEARLETDLSKIVVNDNFHLLDVSFVGSADLDSDKANPDLQLSLEGTSVLKFDSASVGDLVVDGAITGAFYPYLNRTEINTDIALDSSGWRINEQLLLTEGTLQISGVHENGNWTFEPIDYSAGAQFRLSDPSEDHDHDNDDHDRYLQSTVTGRADQTDGDNVVTISAAVGPLDNAFSLLLPNENYTIPPAADSLVILDGYFHACISNYEIAFNDMDCVDGVVVSSTVVIDTYLSALLRPFGWKTGNATVGMEVTASL
jgi:hypothetical protein